MGKYMRKRTGRAPAAELAQVVVGVRTRSRSAAFASAAAAAAPAPKRPRNKQAAARAEVEVGEAGRGDDGGCAAAAAEGCYLQLRSRSLFMAAAAADVRCPVPMEEKAALLAGEETRSGASLEPVVRVAGFSRCSSTASSVDVIVAAARERSRGAAEAREDPDVESSVSDSAVCGRERREATPSSRPPADLSDEESSQAADDQPKHHHRRPMSLAAASAACRARKPAEEEMEEFFAAAEKAEAERFAAKYNFDVARDLPLDAAAGGRFEWTTVAASVRG